MRPAKISIAAVLVSVLAGFAVATESGDAGYDELLVLFADWRAFEAPPLLDGAPDYTATQFAARRSEFLQLRERLDAFEIDGWPIPQQVDWHLVRAEMNGYDFNVRILKPWVRDPAFYQSIWMARSDVPAHEGPTHHAVTELDFDAWSQLAEEDPELRERLWEEYRKYKGM